MALLLMDDTIWGGAKDGFILTGDSIYLKPIFEKAFSIKYDDIDTIFLDENAFHINDIEYGSFSNLPDCSPLLRLIFGELGFEL